MTRLVALPRRPWLVTLIGTILIGLAASTPAVAQSRGKLSRGLEKRLERKPPARLPVIYQGPQAEVDRLARQYGAEGEADVVGGGVHGQVGAVARAVA